MTDFDSNQHNLKTPKIRFCYLLDSVHRHTETQLRQLHAIGVNAIQFRNKEKTTRAELLEEASEMKRLCRSIGFLFIINDHVWLADAIDADGVHLGQDDMFPDLARRILGPRKIIGLSIENEEQLQKANESRDIDYVAASPVYETRSKKDAGNAWGITGLQRMVSHSKHPVIAIGGIHDGNIHLIAQTGAHGFAVISAIRDASDISHAAAKLHTSFNKFKGASQ